MRDRSGSASSSLAEPRSSKWTKDDWKDMERCFIKERKKLAKDNEISSSTQVDPGVIDLDLVVERFLTLAGKPQTGPDWTQ